MVGCQPLAGESMRWIKDTVSGLGNPHDAAAKNRVAKVREECVRGRTSTTMPCCCVVFATETNYMMRS